MCDYYLGGSLPVLICYGSQADSSGTFITELGEQLAREGFCIRHLGCYAEFWELSSQQHFAAFIFTLPSYRAACELAPEYRLLDQIVTQIRHYARDVPIFLYGKQKEYSLLSRAVIRTTGFIHCGEDTVKFTARYVSREARFYLKTSLPPFFRNLMEYVYDGSHSWHCPGHSGGTAFLKSPIGQIFHQFFGENLLRADVCNAVESLGQLLEHSGHIGASERNAAHTFCADRLYFVTHGTSTSNKIVACAHITQGDWVLVDRNCHQSILHAIIQTGAIPIFLQPKRNIYGIVGPIPQEQFSPKWIEATIRRHPLIDNTKNQREGKAPKALILTQSTYDGILYNAETIKCKLDGYIPVLHFDEAWVPHAVFHDFYFEMHAMGRRRPAAKHSTIYATQSAHKLLAGLSQASQILVQNATAIPLDPALLEDSFLMHSSTSPQYAILASLDVSAAMMSGASGQAIVEEALLEALNFRRALREYGQTQTQAKKKTSLAQTTWWFRDWGPPQLSPNKLHPKEWRLNSNSQWHGFDFDDNKEEKEGSERSADFNMLDPIKCTLLTPGLTSSEQSEEGQLDSWGIPAVVVSRYLQENGIVVEKTGLYSILIMFTIGITKGRWKSLLIALQRFKADYDTRQSLWQSMPQLCEQYPQYADFDICELCQLLHEGYRKNRIVEQTHLAYSVSRPLQPKLTPKEAHNLFIQGQYESLDVAQIEGRVSASLISIYPPGVPLVFPGEVISVEVQSYLSCIERQQRQFPGFELHTHGITTQTSFAGSTRRLAAGKGGKATFVVNVLKGI